MTDRSLETEDITLLGERWFRFAVQGIILLPVTFAGLVTLLLAFITENLALLITGATLTSVCAALFLIFWCSAERFGRGYRSFYAYRLRLREQLAIFLKIIAIEAALVALGGAVVACVFFFVGEGAKLFFVAFGFFMFALALFLIGRLMGGRNAE